MSMELLLTTKNAHKIKEIKDCLKDTPYTLITLDDLNDQDEVIESGETFKENAYRKAKHYGDKYQILALSDDSGLEVYSLNNRPGVYSNRYGKTPKQANEKLIKELKDKDPKARFITILCLYNPHTHKTTYYEGILEGVIINKPRGEYGFGYDPIFELDNHKTLAQLTIEEKTVISHRGKALIKLRGDL